MTILFLTTLATSVLGEGELLAPGLAPEPALLDEPIMRRTTHSEGCPAGRRWCPDGSGRTTHLIMTPTGCQWKPCPMLPTDPDHPPPSMKYPTHTWTPHDVMGGGRPTHTWTPHTEMPASAFDHMGGGRRRADGPNPFEGIETFEDLAAYRAACEGHDCPELDTLNLKIDLAAYRAACEGHDCIDLAAYACEGHDCPELDTLNLKIKHEYIPHLVHLLETMDWAGFWEDFGIDRRLDDAEQRRLATVASRRRAVFLHFTADGSPQFGLGELASFDRDLRKFKTEMQDIWADMQKPMYSAGNSNSAPVFHFLYDIPTLTSLRINLLKLKVKLMRQPRLFIGATYYPGQPIGGVNLDVLIDNCEDVIGLLHKTGMN